MENNAKDVIMDTFSDKEKRQGILAIVFFLIAAIVALSYGIYTNNKIEHTKTTLESLFEKENVASEYVKGPVHYSSAAFYEVDHKMWGLFTTSKDYYYVLYADDMEHGILFKGDEDWYENFNPATHEALKDISIKGEVKSTDWKIKDYLEEKGISELGGEKLIYSYYIDGDAKSFARSCIIGGADAIITILCFAVLGFVKDPKRRKPLLSLGFVGIVVFLILALGII